MSRSARPRPTPRLSQIERFELAITVSKRLKSNTNGLERLDSPKSAAGGIATDSRSARDSAVYRHGSPVFVYTGQTGQRRYLLTDSSGRCWCRPAGRKSQVVWNSLSAAKWHSRGCTATLMRWSRWYRFQDFQKRREKQRRLEQQRSRE